MISNSLHSYDTVLGRKISMNRGLPLYEILTVALFGELKKMAQIDSQEKKSCLRRKMTLR